MYYERDLLKGKLSHLILNWNSSYPVLVPSCKQWEYLIMQRKKEYMKFKFVYFFRQPWSELVSLSLSPYSLDQCCWCRWICRFNHIIFQANERRGYEKRKWGIRGREEEKEESRRIKGKKEGRKSHLEKAQFSALWTKDKIRKRRVSTKLVSQIIWDQFSSESAAFFYPQQFCFWPFFVYNTT